MLAVVAPESSLWSFGWGFLRAEVAELNRFRVGAIELCCLRVGLSCLLAWLAEFICQVLDRTASQDRIELKLERVQ
jgi:hypothetical protein